MRIDSHVHLVGTGTSNSGCWYRPKGLTKYGERTMPVIDHGSDLPVPSNGLLPLLGGMIDWSDFWEVRKITNPFDLDARLKQMLGYREENFTLASRILRKPQGAATSVAGSPDNPRP